MTTGIIHKKPLIHLFDAIDTQAYLSCELFDFFPVL